MRSEFCTALAVVSLGSSLAASPASAQIYESVGIRAQGMAGAFVALADDATATWWNPAGLAHGPYFNSIIEFGKLQDPAVPTGAAGEALPSWRTAARSFTAAYPAFGGSYYRLRVSEIRAIGPTAGAPLDRQDQGPPPVRLSSLYLQEFGATVGESAGEHVVIGSTARLVRGSFASTTSPAADASLDRAEALEGGTDTHADLDLGAMAIFGAVRLAIVAKHVTQPTFEVGADRIDLRRQVRTGIAVMSAERGAVGPFTIAFDADLTRTATAVGDIRHWSVGSEAWVANRRLGARGGFAANTVGDARPSVSGGVSLGLRRGFYVDGQLTGGSDETLKGWGVALRVTF